LPENESVITSELSITQRSQTALVIRMFILICWNNPDDVVDLRGVETISGCRKDRFGFMLSQFLPATKVRTFGAKGNNELLFALSRSKPIYK
jgi:hypothetical protein